ncbi:LacI family DNA-binding transcriptional regulator [Oceanobacillus sp. FSL K6-2867]|uniref:LacI family DNA-binding transcriptional regulator n=1 Tax=Oceanobacillus sp. FSL K6-2867 TaxID=2954748 RepID=UPI0030DBA248
MKKITIKDVAKDAGVSISTVSKVINNKGYIGKDSRAKVVESIKRLGYKVNANARSLKSSKSNKVAVLISDISNPYLMSIAKEVEKTIRGLGFHMILVSHSDEEGTENAALQIIIEQQVAAIVVIPTGGNQDVFQSIKKSNIPVISVDREIENVETDLIVDDNYYGSFESVRYLSELGHKRIGIIYGHTRNSIGRDRYQGAMDAIKHFNLDSDLTLIKETNFKEELAYRATMELMRLPDAPTAIYSCNNTMTIGVLKALRDYGVHIPNEVSIIAFGDQKQWELFVPKLTLMTQHISRIGIEASIMLKNRLMLDKRFPEKKIVIRPTLVEGQSCRKIT